ncbi:hypothetical protein [Lignipirellula cremea]|uniref:hypothetical protein n=1 Tax=Lignipirellula cremea TaxID=2528010 RepID=UPI0011A2938E|nr:hypothetical protein [Lignipirellula cremea]
MIIEPTEYSGTDVILVAGDSLDEVPATHQHLISDQICTTFVDPPAQLQGRCPAWNYKSW